MTQDDSQRENESGPYVIFSLSVVSESPIEELEELTGRNDAGSRRSTPPHVYLVARESFHEQDAEKRAAILNASITRAVSALHAGVDVSLLRSESVWVKAFFAFDPGAQTIDAESVSELAAFGAVIWIDALDPK